MTSLSSSVELWKWSDFAFSVQQMVEVDDDRVLARATMRASGRGSGIKLEGDLYVCVWLRQGRVARVEDHLTLKGALHALGLEGETLEAAGLRGSGQARATGE